MQPDWERETTRMAAVPALPGYDTRPARLREEVPASREWAFRHDLRAATRDIHDRLHAHPAFAALLASPSDAVGYARLLGQLHGFHAPVEAALFRAAAVLLPELDDLPRRRRAHLLRRDHAALARCRDDVPPLPPDGVVFEPPLSRPAVLGCLYVIEGATLGGRELSRLLGPMLDALGLIAPEGRRFFLAYGTAQGAMWRRFCDVLDTAAATLAPADRQAMEAAARSTFLIMEDWLTRCHEAA